MSGRVTFYSLLVLLSLGTDGYASDDDEVVFVVQDQWHPPAPKFEFAVLYNLQLGGGFIGTEDSVAVAAHVGYFITEHLALELFGGVFRPTESELAQELVTEVGLVSENAQMTQLLWASGLGLQWNLIHGKFRGPNNLFGSISLYVGAGVGLGMSRVQCFGSESLDPDLFEDRNCPATSGGEIAYEPATVKLVGSVSGGARLRVGRRWSMLVELRDYIFSSRVYRPQETERPLVSDAIRNNLYVQVGVGILLGGESK
ncbi:MAG: hypothetical protein KTR25_06000 [Myxococcales bacterium]|nr:hypothetical protein [Myxococcales bacterium]